jgi:SAM-dependent methyltransferase
MGREFWDDPDWYDCHDNTSVAGPDREPEHYREFVVALPPIGATDHVVDVGAGTGKLSLFLASSYPRVGRISLVEPNEAKLDIARTRLADRIGERVVAVRGSVGGGTPPAIADASLAIIGSVLMPVLLSRAGSLAEGRAFVVSALGEVHALLRPGGWLYDLETVAMPWDVGNDDGPARRHTLHELTAAMERSGFEATECVFRFRDRVVLRASRN